VRLLQRIFVIWIVSFDIKTIKEKTMTNEDSNPTATSSIPPQPLPQAEERTWSVLAHLSVLLNLVTGFAGPIVAFIIYLVYKDRSRKVAYHAMQAMIFQLIWCFGAGILIALMWVVVGVLSLLVVGIVLIPLAACLTPILALMPVGAFIYAIVAAVQVNQEQDFKYWLVGDWVRGTLTGH
jgi:uncharacterized protein